MTITEAKNKLIAWANQQVGYHEGNNNWNKYAQEWTIAGGWNAQNQPWCDIFVDVGFIVSFGIDLASKLTFQPKGQFSALCSASANYYKNHKVMPDGRISKRLTPKKVTAMRRKLKRLALKVKSGELPYESVEEMFRSWMGSFYKILTKDQRTGLISLFESLFDKHILIQNGKMEFHDHS